MKETRIVTVENREERDMMFRVLTEMGYKLIDWGYHWDLLEKNGVYRKIVDVRP